MNINIMNINKMNINIKNINNTRIWNGYNMVSFLQNRFKDGTKYLKQNCYSLMSILFLCDKGRCKKLLSANMSTKDSTPMSS